MSLEDKGHSGHTQFYCSGGGAKEYNIGVSLEIIMIWEHDDFGTTEVNIGTASVS